jgi:leucyl-tRNA synthetase
VNWSTGLNTVLANEQVIDGKCWRTGAPVIQKELPQWFLRTTAYADELLKGTEDMRGRWPDAVLTMQRNWIGRSEGAEITFAVDGHAAERITVFTTRPDTVFGVTFLSIAPEHALLDRIVPASHRSVVEAFRAEARSVSTHERMGEASEKKGVFTGAYVVNPANGQRVPLWAANFVVADYGTGAVMAVPAHDTRDFAFARAHGLAVVRVIHPAQGPAPAGPQMEEAFTDDGVMAASGQFDGSPSVDAKRAITRWLEERGAAKATVSFRLRDWGVSRQRYWGTPIPFVYGEESGVVPLRKQDLPVLLPDDVTIDGVGNALEKHPTWKTTAADGSPLTVRTAHGREPARRETDTLDTFVESSWYFARYTCPDAQEPLDRARVDHWLPVDLYIGGIEHAIMHLLYARFFQMALADCGYTGVREPFKRLLCQGMVCMESYSRELPDGKKQWFYPDEVAVVRDDKGRVTSALAKTDGQPVTVGRVSKMSKSIRNTIDPQALVDAYGADTARLFTLFAAPPEMDLEWKEAGVIGAHRFLKRLWALAQDQRERLRSVVIFAGAAKDLPEADAKVVRKVHATIKRATDAMEKDFAFNTTIAACMELSNELDPRTLQPGVLKLGLLTLVRLLAPMVPHICHELWSQLGDGGNQPAAVGSQPSPGGDLTAAGWPIYDEAQLLTGTFEYPVQINGKMRVKVLLPDPLDAAALEAAALAHSEVRALLGGKPPRKVVAVPRKIINIVL